MKFESNCNIFIVENVFAMQSMCSGMDMTRIRMHGTISVLSWEHNSCLTHHIYVLAVGEFYTRELAFVCEHM